MYFQKSELNVRLTTFPFASKDCEGQVQPQKLLSRTMTNLFILNLSALHEKGGKPTIATAVRIARLAILPANQTCTRSSFSVVRPTETILNASTPIK